MNRPNNFSNYVSVISRRPQATAVIKGSESYPAIDGTVKFFQTARGVIVVTTVNGLPQKEGRCQEDIFGFHIHSGNKCTGNENDPFASAMNHYDMYGCNHPYHSGDLPPLFGNNGYAFSAVLTNRFTIHDIIGKTVIIHSDRDDFTTQPGGNSGARIACGIIRPNAGYR